MAHPHGSISPQSSQKQKALELLRLALGDPNAKFKDGQWEAVAATLPPNGRALVVERTGWGKSMVYFLATKLKRMAGSGPTIVVSPLIALMRDQLKAANQLSLKALTLNSSVGDEKAVESAQKQAEAALARGEIDIVFVGPEWFLKKDFQKLLATSLANTGLVVIDEAHCISDWGHDFRPDYRRVARFVSKMVRTSVLATTATANFRVVDDLNTLLGSNPTMQRGPLDRESLRIDVLPVMDEATRLAWMADYLPNLPGSGIVYVLTQYDAERVSEWLKINGINAPAYHGGRKDERAALEEQLREGHVKALVATVALGMGFDKPDIGFVIHYQSPANLVAYYQQIGRAGRAIDDSLAIMMRGPEEEAIFDFFAQGTPPVEEIEAALDVLRDSEKALGVNALAEVVDLPDGKVRQIVKVLLAEDPPAIRYESDNSFKLVANPNARFDVERAQAVTERKKKERQELLEFAEVQTCFMEKVAKALDDPYAAPCKRCSRCVQAHLVPHQPKQGTLLKAQAFVGQAETVIKPRRRWTARMPLSGFSGNIPEEFQAEPGLALCRYGNPGVAEQIAKESIEEYSASTVSLAAQAIRRQWPKEHFDVIAWMPSRRPNHPIVKFCHALGNEMGLPSVERIIKVQDTQKQKSLRNIRRKLLNLDGAFQATKVVRDERILLVDDVIHSGWTFTIGAALLLQKGAGAVYPFALADAGKAVQEE